MQLLKRISAQCFILLCFILYRVAQIKYVDDDDGDVKTKVKFWTKTAKGCTGKVGSRNNVFSFLIEK